MISHDHSQTVQFQLCEFLILCKSCAYCKQSHGLVSLWHKVSCKALFSVSSQISFIFPPNEPFFRTKIYQHGSPVFWQATVHIQRHQLLTGMKSSIFWDVTCVVCWKSTDTSDNTSCPPSRLKSKPSRETSMKLAGSKQAMAMFTCKGLLFKPDDGHDTYLWNVHWLSMDYITLYPRRQNSS
jgi:hypothetical protein